MRHIYTKYCLEMDGMARRIQMAWDRRARELQVIFQAFIQQRKDSHPRCSYECKFDSKTCVMCGAVFDDLD